MARRVTHVLKQVFVVALLVMTLIGVAPAPAPVHAAAVKLAYVFYGNDVDANAFQGMLLGASYTVDLIPLSSVLSTDFSQYGMVLIADDTGNLNEWGTPALTAAQVAAITLPNIPILGIGEGGYAFFGKLGSNIGWPNGWHGPMVVSKKAGTAAATTIWGSLASPLTLFTTPVNTVGIYLTAAPADVVPVGLEISPDDHADQVIQGCKFLWGNSGGPAVMTGAGKTLFLNFINYAAQFQCPVDQLTNEKYLSVVKTADPALGTAVEPGQVIDYALTYNFSSIGFPGATRAILKDQIPYDTVYVPGSASDGVVPTASGELVWTLSPDSSGTKHFKVMVSETQCVDQRMVNNTATAKVNGYTAVTSNPVYHPVTCPDIVFPSSTIFYAEDEINVHPYPLIAGHPSTVSVRLTNSTAAASPVTIQFQAAPLGIGMVYTTFSTQTVTIPAYGVTLLNAPYTPASSGQASFQILLSGSPPKFTQSNLDVSEDFKPGVTDSLTIPVRNNTSLPGPINLVVDNTCPGWTAMVTPAVLDLGPGATSNATLQVTPPVGPLLGSGCHIDVQAWIGTTMIGGIRKLDVPPVHLPSSVNPPWEEPEIVPVPNPPVAGVPGQLCIDLVNPLGYAKDVTVEFSVADFGAGIPFVPVASSPFRLPARSSGRYCVPWTPSGTGTLHQCIQATLKQAGFQDMHSQRNIDIVRSSSTSLSGFHWNFRVGNPDGIPHGLSFDITPVGIDPAWTPRIRTPKGDPAPLTIGANAVLDLALDFTNTGGAPSSYRTGGDSRIEVAVMLDGRQVGGFTVSIQIPLYLPMVRR